MKVLARALCLAIFVALLSAWPAHAVGYGVPVIVSPGNGATLQQGSPGPVVVNFSDAAVGSYEVFVMNQSNLNNWGDGGGWDEEIYYTGEQDVYSFQLPPLAWGKYYVMVSENSTAPAFDAVVSEFEVPQPPAPLVIDGVTLSLDGFYPLVRDGYQDATRMEYSLNQTATVTAQVVRTDGVKVLDQTLGRQLAGLHAFVWVGADDSGATVGPGNYDLVVTGTSDHGVTRTVQRRVEVRTGHMIKKGTSTLAGSAVRGAAADKCRVAKDRRRGTSVVACRGGRYAKAVFSFRVPHTSYDGRYRVFGGPTSADVAGVGAVVVKGDQVKPTVIRVLVKVTRWRAFKIASAKVSYKYKQPI